MAKSRWHKMTDEQKEKHLEGQRRRRARLTEEQRDKRNEYNRQWIKDNSDKRLASDQKYYQSGKGYYYKWAGAIRARAKKKNIPCDIDADFLMENMPTHCPVLGVELVCSKGRSPGPNSPTLDRIIPEKGYTKGNVMIVCKRANQIKSDATPDEIQKVADYYKLLLG